MQVYNILPYFITIVNYDKNNGFSTILDKLKTQTPVITEEFKTAKSVIEGLGEAQPQNWIKWAESMNYTDRQLLSFLSDVDSGKRSINDLDSYMQSASQQTTLFAKGLTTLKTIGGTLVSTFANMAIMWAATAVIQGVITVIDDAIHRSEKLIEAGEEARQTISEIGDSYNENKTLYELYYN